MAPALPGVRFKSMAQVRAGQKGPENSWRSKGVSLHGFVYGADDMVE